MSFRSGAFSQNGTYVLAFGNNVYNRLNRFANVTRWSEFGLVPVNACYVASWFTDDGACLTMTKSSFKTSVLWLASCCVLVLAAKAESKSLLDFLLFRHAIKDTQAPVAEKNDPVAAHITIDAPVDVVWRTVHIERDAAPNLIYNKLVKSDNNESVFEQKWNVIPFVSRTTCVMDEKDFPEERIEFKLLKSDQFKTMDGAWVFTPTNEGKSTLLELTARLELRRTSSKTLVKLIARRKMTQRLEHVKKLCKETPMDLNVKGKVL